MKILVTGGAGFIGSAVVRGALAGTSADTATDTVVNVDKLTYAANLNSLAEVAGHPGYAFEQVDICDAAALQAVFERHQPDAVMHLAAESHVDRSIDGPADFVETNIVGTYTLLEVSLAYFRQLEPSRQEIFRFHHVSTDEVFGSLDDAAPPFDPETPYRPRSPYSASKAASDHLVMAWLHTYGLPVVLSNCSNNYGPYQFPEKMIPLMILNGLSGQPLPVYGDGRNVRDWLFVDDHAVALLAVLKQGRIGRTYLVGGDAERANIDVVRMICGTLDDLAPAADGQPHDRLISFVTDRPGHDHRYAIDFSATTADLGWRPTVSFEEGLRRTVAWYLDRADWWRPLTQERYAGERLGLGTS